MKKTSRYFFKNEHSSPGSVYPSKTQQQGYQPYRFDSNQVSYNQQIPDHFIPPRPQSQIISGKSSLSINLQKPSHPPIPRQFLQSNLNGTQSLKHHQTKSRSPYPPTFTVQSNHFTSHNQNKDFPINTSQQTKSRPYLQFENPANV
jgi:hypothetical protein